jgi:hypothetical protein
MAPAGQIFMKFYISNFSKICLENLSLVKIRQIQCVPFATEPGISLIILLLMRILLLRVATIRRTTDTFLFFSQTTNVLVFKFRCNISMLGLVCCIKV